MSNNTKSLLLPISLAMTLASGDLIAEPDVNYPKTLNLSLRSSAENDALQGEIMAEGGLSRIVSGRFGFSFFLSEKTGLHGGIEGGVRMNTPGKVSPFVGTGMFLGSWTTDKRAEDDGIDNDKDNLVDEFGEMREETDFLLAIYPEAGLHLWLARSVRLTASYRYYITTHGRNSDRGLYGLGMGFAF